MLEIKKSTVLNGTVIIKEKPVVFINATVEEENGGDSVNTTIHNKVLYEANKTTVRQEIAEFTEQFYAAQDARTGETAGGQ
ncbi:hypothetical protein H8S22_11410 [Anaerostipes sp. NSJ-7]|uniref:Prophage protein n=1 Tax=Anaerostipes hominis (ex Liu et al. 2021) TaxID=2763018 RepID=A0ABR7FSL2_9FIRM|nr:MULTISPECIES: hypothetical protein [Anaerostipes]MBC5678185.1 hypothetical protein [Anaerostipes hominis (ex Liu et al. 2021)]